jgi:hypothetical protein
MAYVAWRKGDSDLSLTGYAGNIPSGHSVTRGADSREKGK